MSTLRVHGTLSFSESNGPGKRYVLWLQGCSKEPKCPGCYNYKTWDHRGGKSITIDKLVAEISQLVDKLDGITISGGEPLDQMAPLIEFCDAYRDMLNKKKIGYKPIILFTGLTELPDDIIDHIDVAIVGPYIKEKHIGHALIGSSNQEIVVCNEKVDTTGWFDTECPGEVFIDDDGSIILTGIDPVLLEEGQ